MAELVSIKRNVDVSPGQAAPAVFHCSQGDVGSKIILGLLNNGTAYSIPSGVTVTIEGSESNGSIFTPISATVSGSDITFYLTGEMTAVAGPAICQAVLKSGSNILGTANFTLEVESSPMGADAPPVFTDAGWTWMLNKLNTEFVPALGNETIIDAIDSKADQSDLTALSNTVAGHTGSITVLNNTVNTLNHGVTENRQNIARKLDKNQGTANAGKYLKVQSTGQVVPVDLIDDSLLVETMAADAKATGVAISKKLNKYFGQAEAGKYLKVGTSGYVDSADLDVTTDKTLSITDKAADAKVVGDELTDLKADLSTVDTAVFGESLIDASTIKANNNTAIVNNNDGTYSVRTTDYGVTSFGEEITLPVGTYLLYGVDGGTAFVSTDGTWNNSFYNNGTNEPKWFANTVERTCVLGFRMPSKPASSFTIEPFLKKDGIQKKVDDMPMRISSAVNALGVPIATSAGGMLIIPENSDLNDYTTVGNFRVSNSTDAITIVNRPTNNPGRLIVSNIANTNNLQQIYIENVKGSIYTRIKAGTTNWSDWNKIANIADVDLANESIDRAEIAINGIYTAVKNLENAGTYIINFANAPVNLGLKNYIGNTQNVHPKVLFIENGFGGHKYWMAYTPYPNGDYLYENPCIAYSDDGLNWTNITGNPLDDPQGDGYNSDTHLVYYNGTLECWYRYVSNGDTRYETIYRQTSTDGITWTEKQAVFTSTTPGAVHYLSPAVLFDGTTYQMWVVDNGKITYYEALATNITSWTKVRTYSMTFTDSGSSASAWHMDVIKDGNTYVMLVMCMVSSSPKNKWSLFVCTSSDNETYTTPSKVLQGAPYCWDEYIYRSCIVKISGTYRIYYSAMTNANVCGMGVTASTSLSNFVGQLTF